MANNYRVALWADIKNNVERRIVENLDRIRRCADPDLLVILQRIQADDVERLKISQQFMEHHRG